MYRSPNCELSRRREPKELAVTHCYQRFSGPACARRIQPWICHVGTSAQRGADYSVSSSTPNDDPDDDGAEAVVHLVEQATDNLPEAFRLVFVARAIEGMSIEET